MDLDADDGEGLGGRKARHVAQKIQLLGSTTSATARIIFWNHVSLLLVLSFSSESLDALPPIFSLLCRAPTIAILLGMLGLAVTAILDAVNAPLYCKTS
jgi:hypothetical protein